MKQLVTLTLLSLCACTQDAGDGGSLANTAGAAVDAAWVDSPVHEAIPRAPRQFASEPYKWALSAIDNFGSCPGATGSEELEALASELRAAEAEAAAKGLRPMLENQRREYLMFLESASLIQCAGGPDWAKADTRQALDRFRQWISRQRSR